MIHYLLSSIDVTTGNKWSREHKRALFITGKKSAARGEWGVGVGGTVAQHYTVHNTLLLLTDENPTTPVLMIFMFLPELQDFVTLYKFHTPRTCKSHCIIYKTARLSKWKWGCAVLFHRMFWHLGNAGFTTQSDHNQENTYTPSGKTEDGSNHFRPAAHMPVVLNNASTFPWMAWLLIPTFRFPWTPRWSRIESTLMFLHCFTILSDLLMPL